MKSSSPLELARAYREAFGLSLCYLADLDGIVDKRPNVRLYSLLLEDGFRLRIDAGIRDRNDLTCLERSCASQPIDWIIGLETLATPTELTAIADCREDANLIFSLDVREGRSLGNDSWPGEAQAIMELVLAAGVSRVLYLDLARIGTRAGPRHDLGAFAEVLGFRDRLGELTIGGGIRRPADARLLFQMGFDSVLVASALLAELQHGEPPRPA